MMSELNKSLSKILIEILTEKRIKINIFYKISSFFVLLILSSCGSLQKIPERKALAANVGILAIPVSMHSTVSTRLLTVSDSIEFRIKALDGSITSKFIPVKFSYNPSFHFFEFPEGRYIINGARLVDSNTPAAKPPNGGNVFWNTANINLHIKASTISVLPEIYHKDRFRVGTRHYREEINIYPFEGDRAKVFIDKISQYKNIDQWLIAWP